MNKLIRNLIAKIPIDALANPDPVVAVLPLEGVIGTSGRFSNAINLSNLEDKIKAAFDIYNLSLIHI